MAIKRYLPKYKKLARFHKPVWLEKRIKIQKFRKQKWERVQKLYYPRKVKFYRQDASAYMINHNYEEDTTVRLKKTYKFLLRDKQRFQLYYGVGKFRFFQLKNLARKLRSRVLTRKLTSGKAMLSLIEDRLDIVLYRLSLVGSIPRARKLIQKGLVKVGFDIIKNTSYLLKPNDIISFDSYAKNFLYGQYLRSHMPYFFFRYKKKRRKYIHQRREIWEQSFNKKPLLKSMFLMKSLVSKLKQKKENVSIES